MSEINIKTMEEHVFEIKDEHTFCKILIEREPYSATGDRMSVYISTNALPCAHVYHFDGNDKRAFSKSLREMLSFIDR